eukprot:2788607-Pyramimonas_sp.AAC.1
MFAHNHNQHRCSVSEELACSRWAPPLPQGLLDAQDIMRPSGNAKRAQPGVKERTSLCVKTKELAPFGDYPEKRRTRWCYQPDMFA